MKALIFNHHPEHIWEIKNAVEAVGVEPFIATERLTYQSGASYSSVNSEYKWLRGPIWFESKILFNDDFKYSDTVEGFDFIFTMNKDIANQIFFDPNKLFFIAAVSWDLLGMNDKTKYTKITAHNLFHQYQAKYLPRFVEQKGSVENKKYITQLIQGFNNSIFTKKLIELKNKGMDVIIAGDTSAPDGIVNDWDTLKQTSLLVHHKSYGIVCTAIMKALDCGIPIYMTRENRYQNGLGDLPDEFFIFADDYSIEKAYEKSLNADNKKIQETFRSIKNMDRTKHQMKELLGI